jgi:hypothetical protein
MYLYCNFSKTVRLEEKYIEHETCVSVFSTTIARNIFLLSKYLVNQNLIHEEIKKRLNSGNACNRSVQNLLSSRLLSRNTRIRMYENIILPVVLYGCGTWSLSIREEID